MAETFTNCSLHPTRRWLMARNTPWKLIGNDEVHAS